MSPRLYKRQRGQMLVIGALAMVALIGFLAVAVDGSKAYVQRRLAQNASDAAALAGTQVLYHEGAGPTVPTAVYEYAERNGIEVSEWSYVYDGEGNEVGVAVTTTTSFPTFLARALGMDSITVSASAEAKVTRQHLVGGGSDNGCIEGEHAIWANEAGGGDKEVHIKGKGHAIVGNVHSNDDVMLGGKNHSITGAISYVSTFNDTSKGSSYPTPKQVSSQPWPVLYDIADYQPGGDVAAAAGDDYHYTDGNLSLSCADPHGLYYATGNVTINCEDISAEITVVAEGFIKIHNHTEGITLTPYSDGLLFFSNRGSGNDVELNGSGYTLNGVLYAPAGHIKIQAEGLTVNGGLIGQRVEFTGGSANVSIQFDGAYCPSGEGGRIHLTR